MAAAGKKVALWPKRDTPKNISPKLGTFFASQDMVSTHHVSPQTHHKLAIKKPHSAHAFFKIPLQKCHSTTPEKYLVIPYMKQ
jgi:hypothetical protein